MTHDEEQAALLAEGIELVRQYANERGPAAVADLVAWMEAQEAAGKAARRLAMRAALGREGTE